MEFSKNILDIYYLNGNSKKMKLNESDEAAKKNVEKYFSQQDMESYRADSLSINFGETNFFFHQSIELVLLITKLD